MRYSKEVKEKACKMALEGIHLKIVQRECGPNPKAVMRYLKKKEIDYNALKEQWDKENKRPKTLTQVGKDKETFRIQSRKKHTPLVVSHSYLEE